MLFKNLQAFAVSLASDFFSSVAPALLAKGSAKVLRQFQSAKDRMLHRVGKYAAENPVGFFQRVFFAYFLKNAFLSSGYPKDLVDQLIIDAVKQMLPAKAK